MALPSLDEFLKPISAASPSGEELRYHPISDLIKEARRREDDVSQGVWKHAVKEPDYKLTVKLCREALTKRGKDLQVAAWLTDALLVQEGLAGLLFGLALVRGLLEQFWETVHPEIEDGDLELRATPLEWIGSQLDQSVHSVPITAAGLSWIQYTESKTVPSEERAAEDAQQQELRQDAVATRKTTPEQFEKAFSETPYAFYKGLNGQVVEALGSIDDLSSFCDERFGDLAPNLGGLRGAVEEVQTVVRVLMLRKQEIEGIVEEQPEPDPAESIEAAAGQAAESAAAGGGSWLDEVDVSSGTAGGGRSGLAMSAEPEDEADAIDRILSAARYLRQQNPRNPAAHLLVRALRWGELRAAGAQPEYSLLAPPPTETRVEIKRLFNESEFEQALEAAAEAAGMPCGRAWLDLHRYSVRCAQNLGYVELRAALTDELRTILEAYPQLPEWTLADDTPCANAETLQWLKEEKLLPGGAAPPLTALEPLPEGESVGSEERPPDAADIAMEHARAGRIQEAVSVLWREAAQESSGRGKFIRHSQLARICLATGHQAIALPILRDLTAEITGRKLEEWEGPELVAQVLAMFWTALGGDESVRDLRHSLYERICRLDPMQALALGDRQ